MRRIAVLIDFTSVCETALEHAAVLCRQTLSPITLVNIALPERAAEEKEIKEKMKSHAHALDREGIPYQVKVGYGEFFSTIPGFLTEIGADFVVVGTHGIKGIADASYGLNILRLVHSLPMPTLIVQGHSEAPQEGYDRMLVPLIGEERVLTQTAGILEFATFFKSKITLLHYLRGEGTAPVEEKKYKHLFSGWSPPVTYDYEEVSPYVHSFHRSIVQYAEIEDMNLMVWTAQPDEKSFDMQDRENLILNRQGIAVLYLPER